MSMARGLREGIADVESRVTNRQERGLRAQDQAIQNQYAQQTSALNQTKIDSARVGRYTDAYQAALAGDEATALEIYNRGTPREKWIDTIAIDEAGDMNLSRRGAPAKIPKAKIDAIMAIQNPAKAEKTGSTMGLGSRANALNNITLTLQGLPDPESWAKTNPGKPFPPDVLRQRKALERMRDELLQGYEGEEEATDASSGEATEEGPVNETWGGKAKREIRIINGEDRK